MMKSEYNVCMAAALCFVFASVVGAAEINLREQVVSTSSVVRLSDVAEIVTGDSAQQERLGAVLLMPAPAPGTERFLRRREIQDLLAARGEDISQLRFGGAEQIAIGSQAAPVTPKSTRKSATAAPVLGPVDRQAVLAAGQMKREVVVDEAVEEKFDSATAEQVRRELENMIVETLSAQAGRRDGWRVSCTVPERYLKSVHSSTSALTCSGGEEPWTGRQRFVVSFNTAKGSAQLPIYADVKLSTQVVVAVRPIERGAVITASHVDWQTVDFAAKDNDRRARAESVEKLIGLEARQAIKTGAVIYMEDVRAPLLVRKGEEITVKSQSGAIRVRTTVRAVQDGARGELVQVETLDKRDRFDVRVTGTREAAVFVAARPANTQPTFERTETALRK